MIFSLPSRKFQTNKSRIHRISWDRTNPQIQDLYGFVPDLYRICTGFVADLYRICTGFVPDKSIQIHGGTAAEIHGPWRKSGGTRRKSIQNHTNPWTAAEIRRNTAEHGGNPYKSTNPRTAAEIRRNTAEHGGNPYTAIQIHGPRRKSGGTWRNTAEIQHKSTNPRTAAEIRRNTAEIQHKSTNPTQIQDKSTNPNKSRICTNPQIHKSKQIQDFYKSTNPNKSKQIQTNPGFVQIHKSTNPHKSRICGYHANLTKMSLPPRISKRHKSKNK